MKRPATAEPLEVMRKAFADTVQDPELGAEAGRLRLNMTYRSSADSDRPVANLCETPPEMAETVKKLVPAMQSERGRTLSARCRR